MTLTFVIEKKTRASGWNEFFERKISFEALICHTNLSVFFCFCCTQNSLFIPTIDRHCDRKLRVLKLTSLLTQKIIFGVIGRRSRWSMVGCHGFPSYGEKIRSLPATYGHRGQIQYIFTHIHGQILWIGVWDPGSISVGPSEASDENIFVSLNYSCWVLLWIQRICPFVSLQSISVHH